MKRIVSLMLALFILISVVPPFDVFASQNENARYGEHTESTIIDRHAETFTVLVTGQPPKGYCFPTGGSVEIVKNTGTPSTFSLGLAWGPFSFSITPGTAHTGAVAGSVEVDIPASNKFYHVYGTFEYEFYHVRVDEYQYSELVNTYYRTTYRLMSEQWEAKEVS